jgi:arsenite-transporting ATPase
MDRIFPAERRVVKAIRPLVSRLTSLPIAGDDVFAATRRFYDRLDGVRGLLTGETASVRLVVNPERMVIAEARRTATYLALFGYRVDAVIANRLLPDAITDPWFKAWKEAHAEHLATIEEGFAPLPVLRAELAAEELVGLGALRQLGDDIYVGHDAASVLHEGQPMVIEPRGSGYVMRLQLPFTDRDDLEVGRRDGELLVRVGAHRRAVALPDSLRRRVVADAHLDDGWLEIRFEQEEATA